MRAANKLEEHRMKLKKSSFLIKVLILILVVYATITLVSLQSQISAKRAEADLLSKSIASAQQENQRLQEAIDNIDTDEGVEEIAHSKLGLVAPGEIVFNDVGQ